MKRPKPKDFGTEIECPACDCGFPLEQPVQPNRKIYPAQAIFWLKGELHRLALPRGEANPSQPPSRREEAGRLAVYGKQHNRSSAPLM